MLTEITGGGKFDFEHWAHVLQARMERGLPITQRPNHFDYIQFFLRKDKMENSSQSYFQKSTEVLSK